MSTLAVTPSGVTLDAGQRSAVAHREGPCLVVAGPGSGKTRVIVERFLALLEAGATPQQLLVLTYTNKAAREMRERVELARGGFVGESPLSTYHAFSGRILREWGWLIGIAPGFRIADDAEQWLHLDAVLTELRPRLLWNPIRPHDLIEPLLKLFGSAKQELVTPARYAEWAAQQRASGDAADDDAALLDRHEECAAVYAALQERYRRLGVLDHDDTILYAEQLLREHDAARKGVSGRIHYVMVDEYQDTNYAQARLVETLVEGHKNVLVVADDDQAIYKFRGASQANLQRFTRTYPGHAQVMLLTNYRSTPEIVSASRAVIGEANALTRIPKEISASRPGGDDVEIWEAPDERSESDAVARECVRLIEAGAKPSSLAWLFRRHADMQSAIAALNAHGVPFQVHGGRGYFQQGEVKDLMALLGAIADMRDSQALLRCLLLPVWKVSSAGRMALVEACVDHDTPLVTLLTAGAPIDGLDPGDLAAARSCVEALTELHGRSPRDDVRDLFFDALDVSEYLGILDAQEALQRRQTGANLNKFGELLEDFADWSPDRRVSTALRYLTVLRDAGQADEIPAVDAVSDGVALLTAHSAKGLEWPVVFLANCIEKRWPGRPGFGARLTLPDALVPELPPEGDGHTDEERRLFYVAATRARDRLVLTWARRYPSTFRNEAEVISPFLAPLRELAGVDLKSVPQLTDPRARKRRVAPKNDSRLRISVSDIAAFRECARQFEYRRRYRLPVRTTPQSWYGTMIHAVLQEAAQQRRGGATMDADAVVAIWHETWRQTPGPKGAHPHLLATGEEQLRRYCASPAWRDATVDAVESSFTLPTNHLDIVGRFDRIDRRDGALTVVDYKTGPPREADALLRDLQVRAYAVAASQIERAEEMNVELHYLQTGDVVGVELDAAKLDKAFKQLSVVSQEILGAWTTGEFPPSPSGWKCRRCDYRTVCDEGRAAAAAPPS